jgi:hypothetical protein
MAPVVSGGACAGFLVKRGPQGVEAFDRNEKSLGIFPEVIGAATAVERSAAPPPPKPPRSWRQIETVLVDFFRAEGCEILAASGESYIAIDDEEAISLSNLARHLVDPAS